MDACGTGLPFESTIIPFTNLAATGVLLLTESRFTGFISIRVALLLDCASTCEKSKSAGMEAGIRYLNQTFFPG
jgi:hypothetical protein